MIIITPEKKKVILLFGIGVSMCLVLLALYFLYTKNKAENTIASRTSDSGVTPLIQELKQELKNNNSTTTFIAFENLSKTEKDTALAESLKLYAAASLINLDKNAGNEYYIAIYKDYKNTPFMRAYALTQLTRYASGDGTTKPLMFLFEDSINAKTMSHDEIILAANKKILELYPMPSVAARVAQYELKRNPTKENALALRALYFERIVLGANAFSQKEGLAHFVPETYYILAQFLRESESVGAATTVEVREYYDKAYTESLAQNQPITKQFIMLSYTDYLLSKKLNKDAEKILGELLKENLTPMVIRNLIATKGASYSYILAYIKTGTPLASELSKKLGEFIQ